MPGEIHFNSMKVRLIQGDDATRFSGPLFQFHEGSINTSAGVGTIVLGDAFQFHEGSINTLRC